MNKSTQPDRQKEDSEEKKPYHTPRLEQFGSLVDGTLGGIIGTSDSGGLTADSLPGG